MERFRFDFICTQQKINNMLIVIYIAIVASLICIIAYIINKLSYSITTPIMTVLLPLVVQMINLLVFVELKNNSFSFGIDDDDMYRINRFTKEARLVKKGNKNDLIPEKLVTKDETIYPVTSCEHNFLKEYKLEYLILQIDIHMINDNNHFYPFERSYCIKKLTLDFEDQSMRFTDILQTFRCLTSVSTTERCSRYISIGNKVFSRDKFDLLFCKRNSNHVTINEHCNQIGEFAFSSCQQLCFIVIPASVKQIGNSSFSSCIRLRRIKFSESSNQLAVTQSLIRI